MLEHVQGYGVVRLSVTQFQSNSLCILMVYSFCKATLLPCLQGLQVSTLLTRHRYHPHNLLLHYNYMQPHFANYNVSLQVRTGSSLTSIRKLLIIVSGTCKLAVLFCFQTSSSFRDWQFKLFFPRDICNNANSMALSRLLDTFSQSKCCTLFVLLLRPNIMRSSTSM